MGKIQDLGRGGLFEKGRDGALRGRRVWGKGGRAWGSVEGLCGKGRE